MSPVLQTTIICAHALVYPVVALSIWIFAYQGQFYQKVIRLRSLPLIYWGYACFAIAASYEIAEHIGDRWIYVSQISSLNQLFYTFINLGLGLIALGLKKSKLLDVFLVASLVAVPLLYGVNDGKSLMQGAQLVTAAIFIYKWYDVMRDWRVFLYLLFSNGIALGLGIALIVTGNQVFHIFIGPASALGLLVLGYVAWIKPQQSKIRMGRPGTEPFG